MARSVESRDSERRSHGQARTPGAVDRQPTSLLLQLQRAAGNRAVTGALQRQVFKPRPKGKRPEPKTPKPTPPPPKSKKRLDWQKMVVEPLRQALKLAKKGPRQFEAAAMIADRVGGAVAEFNTRALDEERPENGTVFQLLRLVHSLYWELHAGPNKGKGTRLPYASDFPGDLVDRATWIEDLLKKRVAAKPDDSHVSLVTEHVVTTEQNMTGPNDVDTVTSHLITAEDVAEQLSPALNKIH